MRHWLGTETSVGPYRKRFRLFTDAVEFAHSLKLRNDTVRVRVRVRVCIAPPYVAFAGGLVFLIHV